MKNSLQLIFAFFTILTAGCSGHDQPAGTSEGERWMPDKVEISKEVREGFEAPPVFKASDILDPELRRGARFSVDDTVYNDGYMNHFIVHSDFGDFQASSEAALRYRFQEIEALGWLSEISDSRAFVDAAKKSGKETLLAPYHAVKNLAHAVANPGETLDMVAGIPQGVGRFFSSVAEKVKSAGGNGDGSTASSAVSVGAGLVGNYLGYDDHVRDLQKNLGIDPYSDNQLLHSEIRRVAEVETTVGTAFRFVPGIPGIKLVGKANSYLNKAKKISIYQDPDELKAIQRGVLHGIGVPDAVTESFLVDTALTPTTRTLMVDAISEMEGVENRDALVEMAISTDTPDEALLIVEAVQELERIHSQEAKLHVIVQNIKIPAAVTEAGSLVVPLPVDHLVWRRAISGIASRIEQRVKEEHPSKGMQVRISGTTSKRTRLEIEKLGASLLSRGVR